uniref:Crystallin gamma N n=1 Tax=Pelusios castaneus TaxID=367368 RepID=A0A8C8VPK8_9SAUR
VCQRPPSITFYEGKYFTGRKLEVFGSCDNFQDRGFMNRVNSIWVQSGAWICFDHPDFRGQQYILEHGEYPDFYRWNGHSDHMASCKPVGMHGEHYRMEIFDGSHFSGDSMEFIEDCSFLQGHGWNKNCVNAIKVYGDGAARLPRYFKGCDFSEWECSTLCTNQAPLRCVSSWASKTNSHF